MTKVGNCVDSTSLRLLMEQVSAIHAEQLATGNGKGVASIEACIKLIDRVLALPTSDDLDS